MKLRKMHWLGMSFGVIVLFGSILYYFLSSDNDFNLLLFLGGIGLGISLLPFIISVILENKKDQETSEMFLEFSRNLAESVSTGTPISKSIVNMSNKNYGALTPFVKKLANQIALGIPVERALETFTFDVNNPVISRAVTLISEAEKAGGEVDYILDSVAHSIAEVEKLKKERKAAIYNLVVQGYIIFFIFIGIMLVMQFKILPLTSGIGSLGSLSSASLTSIQNIDQAAASNENISINLKNSFLYLLLAQGLFAGLTIGKLTEGTIKSGIKHSFILSIAAFLISTGAQIFITPASV